MKVLSLTIVAFMAQIAMAVNFQNITLSGDFRAAVKSLAELKGNVETDSLLDEEFKNNLLKYVKECEEMVEELRSIDESCPTVVTNKMVSDECDEYFDDRLPKIKDYVNGWTLVYKFYRLEALKKSGKKRQFIKQCVEDIFSTDYNPQDFFVGANVELKEEIKKDGYLVNYSIGLLEPKENPVSKWLKGVSQYCGREIVSENTYFVTEIASDYAEEIAKRKNAANGKYSYSFLKFDGAPDRTLEKEMRKIYRTEGFDYEGYKGRPTFWANGNKVDMIGNRLLIKYKEDSDFYYSLNGKKVLHCKISGYADEVNFNGRDYSPATIKTSRFDKYGIGLSLRPNLGCDCINGKLVGNKCKGSMLVTDDEFEKGFVGVFSWDKPSRK